MPYHTWKNLSCCAATTYAIFSGRRSTPVRARNCKGIVSNDRIMRTRYHGFRGHLNRPEVVRSGPPGPLRVRTRTPAARARSPTGEHEVCACDTTQWDEDENALSTPPRGNRVSTRAGGGGVGALPSLAARVRMRMRYRKPPGGDPNPLARKREADPGCIGKFGECKSRVSDPPPIAPKTSKDAPSSP